MTWYQAYVGGSDGHFTSHRAYACHTDEQAVEWTKQLLDQRPAELRCGERLVSRLTRSDDRRAKPYRCADRAPSTPERSAVGEQLG